MAIRDDLTRRRLLGLGTAAAASGALGVPQALARGTGPRAASFGVALPAGRRRVVVEAPSAFGLAGLRWRGGGASGLRGALRARRAGGAWSAWTPIAARADHGPDGGGRVHGTDPVWFGEAHELDVRVDRSPPGLEARFVATAGTRAVAPPTARAAATGAPAIVSRAQWGGDRVTPRDRPSTGQVKLAFVHHTVNPNDYARSQSAAIVLAIARYHRDSLGWDDLGYNFLVDRFGVVFEGRAGGIERAVVGAQAAGWNAVSTGIASIGTFTDAALPAPALEAIARLLAWKLPLHACPVSGSVELVSGGGGSNRWPRGQRVTFDRISGHRDGCTTSCPGDALYRQLPALRARVAQLADGAPTAEEAASGAGSLTIGVNPGALVGAGSVTAAGRLLDLAGAPRVDVPVLVEKQGASGRWQRVARAPTDGSGSYAAVIAVGRSARLRARVSAGVGSSGGASGSIARAATVSSPVDVSVAPRVGVSLPSDRAVAGRRLRIGATVSPKGLVADAIVSREVAPGRFSTVAKVRLTGRGGRLRGSVRVDRPGVHRVVVRTRASGREAAARSLPVFARVTRRATGRAGRPVSA